MTDNYTPTTENVRAIYAQDSHSEAHRKKYEAEFDRWLSAHESKLLRQAARDLNWFGAQGNLIHPDTAWTGVKACITALENVADEKEPQ